MEFTEHVADYQRALTVRLVRGKGKFVVHIEQYPAVHGLESVAHVGNCARYVDRHGVGYKGLLYFTFDVYVHHLGAGEHFFYIFLIYFLYHFSTS